MFPLPDCLSGRAGALGVRLPECPRLAIANRDPWPYAFVLLLGQDGAEAAGRHRSLGRSSRCRCGGGSPGLAAVGVVRPDLMPKLAGEVGDREQVRPCHLEVLGARARACRAGRRGSGLTGRARRRVIIITPKPTRRPRQAPACFGAPSRASAQTTERAAPGWSGCTTSGMSAHSICGIERRSSG